MAHLRSPMPITLLSGFLGSGKTTLLKHILTSSDHALRIAVIVNDMAALNIDAALIRRHVVSTTREKLIQLQNGCICCTLRGDLLEELARLAKNGQCDYVVIESTGISEPMQVAETFTAAFTEAMLQAGQEDENIGGTEILHEIAELGGLQQIAQLDTLVTVIDAFNFQTNFATTEFISDRWGKDDLDPEDERTVTDLMVDQIEFATTIILNKVSTVPASTRLRILAIIKKLNPTAKILSSDHCRVSIRDVVNTGEYDFEKAATGMGWLKSLHDLAVRDVDGQKKISPKPETEEYGISSFVYCARRPFHPKRLFRLIHDKFVLMEGVIEDEDEDEEMEVAGVDGDQAHDADSSSNCSSDEDDFSKSVPPETAAANKAASPEFRGLLRSKGFIWLATRPNLHGEWSQAGTMLTLQGGGSWFCAMDRAHWPQDEATISSIEADFDPSTPWGDRRQELVLIGEKVQREVLEAAFDACLLTDVEMRSWENAMEVVEDMHAVHERLADLFEDGFEDWPEVDWDEDEDEGEHAHAHAH